MSKLTLRVATDADKARAAEFRHSLKGWSQDNMILALAIVYTDFLALQTVIHQQRQEIKKLKGELPTPVKESPLVASVKRMATTSNQDVLTSLRAKNRSHLP